MSSSIMSSVAMARPGATRPALSFLVATHASRTRSLWHCARSHHGVRDKVDRIAQSIDKDQRHPEAGPRSKTDTNSCWPNAPYGNSSHHRGWTSQWARWPSAFASQEKTYWDAELEQMNRRIAHLKKQVARDPYDVLFGYKPYSAHYIGHSDATTAWPDFLRTFWEAEKPMADHPSKANRQDFKSTQSPTKSTTSGTRDALQYDPISGRMAPTATEPETAKESMVQSSNGGESTSNLSSAHAKPDTIEQPTSDAFLGSGQSVELAAQSNLNPKPVKKTKTVASSFDSTFDPELEARIVAETTRAQLSDPVDSSGSESGAFFSTSRAAVHATHYPPEMTRADTGTQKARSSINGGSHGERDAKLRSDVASSVDGGANEDMTSLDASDIRARYTLPQSDGEVGISSSEIMKDRMDSLRTPQKPSTASQSSPAVYRILAYDTATATVTTTEADTFFGTNEVAKPHEILSRLHHPAKFVPHFAQMQQDGYEIATGGGDILVFKRPVTTAKYPSTPPAGLHDFTSPQIQADLAQYSHQDSYDSSNFVRHYHPSPTSKPSASGHSIPGFNLSPDSGSPSTSTYTPISTVNSISDSGHSSNSSSTTKSASSTANSKSKSKSKSTFRKVLRRMFLTGTVTAGSCYAIGVLTEYFRTGGVDGRGADGFTPFESERRHRE